MEVQKARRIPFPRDDLGKDLDRMFNRSIAERLRGMRGDYLSSSNVYRIKHGRRWYALHADNPAEASEAGLHSSETAISVQRFVDHDLTIVTDVFKQLSEAMHDHFMRTMMETMEEATSASGNVVTGTKNIRKDLEEMLSKIKFGVDQYGVPSGPSALVSPAYMRKIEMLAAQEDEQHDQRIAAITEAKMRDALDEEARRIARYRFL